MEFVHNIFSVCDQWLDYKMNTYLYLYTSENNNINPLP